MTKKIFKKRRVIFVISLMVLVLLGWYGEKLWQGHTHKNLPIVPPIPTVTVQVLSNITMPITVQTFGQVVSNQSSMVSAQADGVITQINFKPGDKVQKDQILFTLQSSDTGSQLNQLAAALEIAKQRYDRNQKLKQLSVEAISEIDLEQSKANYEQALAVYQEAKIIHSIRSPIEGVISDTDIGIGDFVNAGQILVSIVDLTHREIKYELPSANLNQVKTGQTVLFYPEGSDPNQAYSATVSYVSPLLNPNDESVTLRAVLSSKILLPLNTLGRVVQILNPTNQTLAVSQDLVQADTQGFYVYVLEKKDQNNIAAKRYFIPGELSSSGLYPVTSGLKLGEKLITTNPQLLTAGEVVQESEST